MADYFVSSSLGSDSTGTGAASSPWKTIAKAIGSSPAISLPGSGTTRLILRGGDVFSEAVTLGLSPGSANPLEIVGDPDGSIFTGAGGSGGTGVPVWRAWSDETTPIASPCFATSAGYVALRRIRFVGGSGTVANAVDLNGATAAEITDCDFLSGKVTMTACRLVNVAVSDSAGSGVRIRRCDFEVASSTSFRAVYVVAARTDADYAIDMLIEGCRFRGGARTVEVVPGGGVKTGNATGIRVACCSFDSPGIAAVAAAGAATGAMDVTGCLILGASTGLNAATSGQITEDYNAINALTSRSNVAAGSNTVLGFAPSVNLENQRFDGSTARPFLEPLAGSVLLGMVPRPSGVTVDLYGRSRPNPCAAGCLERVDPPAPPSGPVCVAY